MNEVELGLNLAAADRWGRRLPAGERFRLVRECLAVGQETAVALRNRYGELPVDALLDELGVAVVRVEDEQTIGPVRLRARYLTAPPRIELFMAGLRELQQQCEGEVTPELVVDLVLAHELFHHLEATSIGRLAQRYRVTTLGIGPFAVKAGVPAASEIAAHAFARAWTGAGFFPAQLEEWPQKG